MASRKRKSLGASEIFDLLFTELDDINLSEESENEFECNGSSFCEIAVDEIESVVDDSVSNNETDNEYEVAVDGNEEDFTDLEVLVENEADDDFEIMLDDNDKDDEIGASRNDDFEIVVDDEDDKIDAAGDDEKIVEIIPEPKTGKKRKASKLHNPEPKKKKASKLEEEKLCTWKDGVNNDLMSFVSNNNDGGPIHDLPVGSEPLDYFRLFFTDDACKNIMENTNKYAATPRDKHNPQKWKKMESIDELHGFMSILLIMGMIKMPTMKCYWATDSVFGHLLIKNIMPRDRFLKILRNFHLSDNSSECKKGDEGYYMMQKIDPLYSTLKSQFQLHFSLYTDVSIDEALLKYKGRLGIVQYMPLKPAKRGIKIWMMCSSFTGYIYNFEVYCGKNGQVERSNDGLGFDVVKHLSSLLKRQGHHLYFDRFFTSVPLVIDLLKSNQYATGTIMTNRKHLPNEIKGMKLKNSGDSLSFQCEEYPNLTCTVWKDKKEIAMLSTSHKNEITSVKRRVGSERTDVTSPLMFSEYNGSMGGVDQADQRRKYYTVARKSCRWWLYLFWFLLGSAISNAFILYTLTNMPLVKEPMNLLQFRNNLCKSMASKLINTRRDRILSPKNCNIQRESHKKVKIAGRKKVCKRCSSLKVRTAANYQVESSYMCETCQICLCQKCFGPYHDEMK